MSVYYPLTEYEERRKNPVHASCTRISSIEIEAEALMQGNVTVCRNQSDYSHSPFRQQQFLFQRCNCNVAANRYRETVSLTPYYVPVTGP
jgi:hypothetical protein